MIKRRTPIKKISEKKLAELGGKMPFSTIKKPDSGIRKVSPKRKSLQAKVLEAQKVFNAWVRSRDKKNGCISCKNGKVEDAGHYISAGANTSLRFHEWNNNGQCVYCNRILAGNIENYRVGLIKKIGLQNVLFLESFGNKPKKWEQSELDEIIEKYGGAI